MRNFALFPALLVFTLLFAACGESNLDKLNGAWDVDAKAMVEGDPAMKAQLEQNPELAKTALGTFSLSFDSAKKTMAVAMGPMAKSGAFTVVSDKGDTVVLSMEGQEFNVQLKGKDSIVMWTKDVPDTKIPFTRKK